MLAREDWGADLSIKKGVLRQALFYIPAGILPAPWSFALDYLKCLLECWHVAL